MPAESRVATVTKAHLDYADLQDEELEDDHEVKQEGSVRLSKTILVTLETRCEIIWAYTVCAKGYASDLWLPGKIADASTTVGAGSTRIVIKTDTEPAIIDLRNEVARKRNDVPTGFDDFRVGD